jgi:soluble lytic murein transglycosylase
MRSGTQPRRRAEKSQQAVTILPPDLDAAKQAIALIRKSKWKDAAALAASVSDPVAKKLIEWALLRSSDSPAGFERYVVFLRANPDWPGALLRRSAEARLWQERRDGTTVRRFVGSEPVSSVGRLALARVLMNEGDRDGSAREVRAVWQSAELSTEMESAVLDTFTDMLSRPTMLRAWTATLAPRILALRCALQNASVTIESRS